MLPTEKSYKFGDARREADPGESSRFLYLTDGGGLRTEGEVLWRDATASVLSIQHDATGQRRIDKSDEGAVN